MEKQKEKKIFVDMDNISSIIKNLSEFESNLRKTRNINSVLTTENLLFFNSLLSKENIKINLLLSKIFGYVLSKDYLYKAYIPTINENNIVKLDILLELIYNCSLVIENLNNFIFSSELYELKKNSFALLNFLYNNFQKNLKSDEDQKRLNKMMELIDSLPQKYYSEAFNEMCESQEFFEIYKSHNIYSINKFEDKFSEVNNCFEQFEIFKKFIELNSDIKLIENPDIEVIEIKKKNNIDSDLIDFYEKYGMLLIKFCAYHYYIFLDKRENGEEVKEEKNEKINENNEEGQIEEESAKIIFLINKQKINENNDEVIKDEKKEEEDDSQKNKRIESLLSNKKFKSNLSSQEYKDLIKKGINFYLLAIKDIKEEPKIKTIVSHLTYFLESSETNSYYPLYLKNLDKMLINDNFTQSFITNVSPGEINKFYFETNFPHDLLVYIEFYLDDKTKDINFELNQYDNNSNSFSTLYKHERTDESFRFYIYCRGYSIYELVFDNYYSWFMSKDVNFRVSYLIPIIDEESEENYDNKKYFVMNGEKFYYSKQEKTGKKLFDIPIVINLNNIKTVTLKKNENEEKREELEFKENKDDDDLISKLYLNYVLFNYFKKQKLDKNKELIVSILSQNKDLSKLNEDLKNAIINCKNEKEKKFIKFVGFYPDKKINDIKIKYRLFDLNEQLIINHKLLMHKQINKKNEENKVVKEEEELNKEKEEKKEKEKKETEIKESKESKEIKVKNNFKSILLIHLNKNLANITLFRKGEFHSKITLSDSDDINFDVIEFNKDEEILDFIEKIQGLKELEIILTCDNDLKEEDKKITMDLLEKIKSYCQEKVNPPISVYQYDINEICSNIIKYIYYLNEN